MSVLVIAEIGSAWVFSADWRRNFNNALKAIHVAASAGANICKFQWCSDPALMATRRHINDPNAYWRLNWPTEWHAIFAKEAADAGIEYMCTCYIPADVKTIAPYVQRFKIASLEYRAQDLWDTLLGWEKPILASTGCLTESQAIVYQGQHFKRLHCVAAYPVAIQEMNLNVVHGPYYDGLSDHSAHLLTGAVAVGAGAEIIEVHFRLYTTPTDNPDYKHSHNPKRLNLYVANVRDAERMMGDGIKRVMPSEEPLK